MYRGNNILSITDEVVKHSPKMMLRVLVITLSFSNFIDCLPSLVTS